MLETKGQSKQQAIVIVSYAMLQVPQYNIQWLKYYYMWLDLRKLSLSAQEMKSNLLLIIKPTLLHYLKILST